MQINKYNIFEEITALFHEEGSQSILIATKSGGGSKLYKRNRYSIDEEISNATVNVTGINNIIYTLNYFICSVESPSYICVFLRSVSLDVSYVNKPVGLTEDSIDLTYDSNYVYLLLPGIASGTNAEILKYSKSIVGGVLVLTYIDTIDLYKSGDIVINASKIDIDGSGNLWVISEDNPRKLTKVYYSGGWDFITYTLI
jgi:hypothetical protein